MEQVPVGYAVLPPGKIVDTRTVASADGDTLTTTVQYDEGTVLIVVLTLSTGTASIQINKLIRINQDSRTIEVLKS